MVFCFKKYSQTKISRYLLPALCSKRMKPPLSPHTSAGHNTARPTHRANNSISLSDPCPEHKQTIVTTTKHTLTSPLVNTLLSPNRTPDTHTFHLIRLNNCLCLNKVWAGVWAGGASGGGARKKRGHRPRCCRALSWQRCSLLIASRPSCTDESNHFTPTPTPNLVNWRC